MTIPSYQAAGSILASTGGGVVSWPSHQLNDIALLIVETANEAVTLSDAQGFAAVSNSPQSTGTAGDSAATRLSVYWCRATSGSMTGPTLADPGDHVIAQIVTFRGCVTSGNPWDVTAGDVEATATSSVTIPGLTTAADDCLIVDIVSERRDVATAGFDTWANGSLSSFTVRLGTGTSTNVGNGGGFGMATGGKAAHGVVSATTARVMQDNGASGLTSQQGRLKIALKPGTFVAPIPTFVAAGVGVHGTGAVTPAWPTHLENDIALLLVESAAEAVTLSTSAGFVEIADSPQSTGTAGDAAATRLTVFWCRATSAGMSSPTVADPGDHVVAQIITFRGCIQTGNPWDVTSGDVLASDSTTGTIPGDTTTVQNCLVVAICSHRKDTSQTSMFASPVNGDLSNIQEIADYSTSDGNGGGFGAFCGGKASIGAYAATLVTLDLASKQGRISVALKPPTSASPGPGDPSAGHRYWRMLKTSAAATGPAYNEVELVERIGTAGGIGSSITAPAKMHPATSHIRPTFKANQGGDLTAEFDIDVAIMSVPAGYSPDIPTDQVTRKVETLYDSDGVLIAGVGQDDGAGVLPLVKGMIQGVGVHGQDISFSDSSRIFQSVPEIVIEGGITYQPESKWGTAAAVDAGTASSAPGATAMYDDSHARNSDEGGFQIQSRLRQGPGGTLTRAGNDFGASFDDTPLLAAPGDVDTCVASALAGSPSFNDFFQCFLRSQCKIKSKKGLPYRLYLGWAYDTTQNSGATWQQRASGLFTFATIQTGSYHTQFGGCDVTFVINLTSTDTVRARLVYIRTEGDGSYDASFSGLLATDLAWFTGTATYCSRTVDGSHVKWKATGYV